MASQRSSKIVNRVKEVAIEDAQAAKKLAVEAVKSRAWLYPLKGVVYYAYNRELWAPLRSKIVQVLGTNFSVMAVLFAVAYLPQAALLSFVNGPWAFVSTIFLVLSESSTVSKFVSRTFFIEDALTDTFDGVLLKQGHQELVSNGRLMRQQQGRSDTIQRLGKLIKRPFTFSSKDIIRSMFNLLWNFVPLIGPVVYLYAQSRSFGGRVHARYFQLRGMSKEQEADWRKSRAAQYTAFSVPATLLEMVPVVGLLFTFTNTAGAALWAADLENARSKPSSLQPAQQEYEEPSDPPAYEN